MSRTGAGSVTLDAASSGWKPRRGPPSGSRFPGNGSFLVANQPSMVSHPASARGVNRAARRDRPTARGSGTLSRARLEGPEAGLPPITSLIHPPARAG